MDYDFRSYEGQIPMYRNPSSTSTSSPMYAPPPPPSSSNMYPKINQSGSSHTLVPPTARPFPHHPQNPAPPPPPSSSSSSSGLGIRVMIKPEYRITPPLSSIGGEIPRSNFQFDFEFEKRILAEAEKGNPNWAKLGMENIPPRRMPPPPSASVDPTVGKYIASGLNREAASLGVAHYGDNPTKVREFANGYNILREMGFQSKNVAEALVMNDNDTDKALAHILNSAS